MLNRQSLEAIFHKHGFSDFKWINTEQIKVSQWVRFKCTFGCGSYGKKASCPPNIPAVAECREFISEYRAAAVFHLAQAMEHPEDRSDWSREINYRLLKVEREVFLQGYHKAFLLFMDECRICNECPGERQKCLDKKSSRPCPESLGIDVFSTVREIGYPIEVLTDYQQTMNRYAFILLE